MHLRRSDANIRLMRNALCGVVAGFTVLVLTPTLGACSPSPMPTPTPVDASPSAMYFADTLREARYDAAVGRFGFDLPPGFTWPEESPPREGAAYGSLEEWMRGTWGCAVIAAAWDAAGAGDLPEAEARIALLDQDPIAWDIRSSDLASEGMRDVGASGVCQLAADLVTYR